ncbi:uncharacterized protein LOC128183639 [Crassostrea angulata]|uniref:uncharacterized protein LOC128183639 n=1 Tax=Magallana angulata TaxID=2784310 RepID=UPI0022B20A52|nr:uncharacterized protein LOC128183639 [Crassostrea angulata]
MLKKNTRKIANINTACTQILLQDISPYKPQYCSNVTMLLIIYGLRGWIYVYLTLLYHVYSVICQEPAKCYSWDTFQQGRLEGNVLRSLSRTGPFTCIKECLLRNNCKSVNYNHQFHQCEINHRRAVKTSLKVGALWRYLERNKMDNLVDVSPCNGSICKKGERCVELADNSTTCSITECLPHSQHGNKLVFSKATPEHSPLAVGSVVHYHCATNVTVNITRRCQQTGNWKDLQDPIEYCVSKKTGS